MDTLALRGERLLAGGFMAELQEVQIGDELWLTCKEGSISLDQIRASSELYSWVTSQVFPGGHRAPWLMSEGHGRDRSRGLGSILLPLDRSFVTGPNSLPLTSRGQCWFPGNTQWHSGITSWWCKAMRLRYDLIT